MIVVPVLIAVALGFAVRPARRAQLAIGLLMSVFALTVWFVTAHDDGEIRTVVCSVAGLWALVAAGGAGQKAWYTPLAIPWKYASGAASTKARR